MKRAETRPVGLAVVTGATGGIGREMCVRFAEAGYDIVAQYRSNDAAAAALSAAITLAGRRCTTVPVDLGDPRDVDVLCAAVREELQGPDARELRLLINNAARLLGPSFDDATVADFDAYFAINVRAPFFLAQQLSRLMTPGGSIVNISSASAHFSSPGDIVYAMSKAAIESLTRNMAEAVASKGIRVNTIVPGFTDNGNQAFSDPAAREYMSEFAVLGGVSVPSDVVDAALYLASAARATGTTLDVSGGSTLAARGRRAHSVKALL